MASAELANVVLPTPATPYKITFGGDGCLLVIS
jgi:hypothetical protein